ncbi:F-box protein [Hibiscus syriacus]|uniref:Phospholipase A1 n=1 Tax=Hibiscus syriacus TaxID=106335 RepID=A0A6A2WWK8_HIBSY|nr:F-box protein [Hibiscus syriacus]
MLFAFNGEKVSKWVGFSRYSMEDLFSKVGLEIGNPYKYRITKFFYARSEIQILDWCSPGESNWIGYVAVTTDEGKTVLGRREILIAWRGTQRTYETINDLQSDLVSAADILETMMKIPRCTMVLSEVRRLMDLYKDEEISITLTGHCLGSAVATLNAVDIPSRWGLRLQESFSRLKDLRVLRIKNEFDIVPTLPPSLPLLNYTHVGEELLVDARKSPNLKTHIDLTKNLMIAHQLEIYLHGVAGTHGDKGEFKLEVNRDISLVNIYLDALKDELQVPAEWWIEKNKGMVQQDDGSWILDDHEPDIPPTLLT